MPIRPQHRWLYPVDWPQLSALVRFGRAAGRCEACGRPHGRTVVHLGDGRWWDAAATLLSNLESSRTLDDDAFGVVLHGRAAEVAPTLDRIVSDLMA